MIEQKQKSFSFFMDRTKHNINFSKANDRNNTNAINKFTTLNLKYNICMHTYTLQKPIHHTVLQKRKNKISVRHPHTMYVQHNKTKNRTASLMDRTKLNITFQNKKTKVQNNAKCIQQIYNCQSQVQLIHA